MSELAGPAEFAPTKQAPPPAKNFSSFGDTAFLGRPIGVFFSLPYSHSYVSMNGTGRRRVTYNRPDETLSATEKSFTEAKGVEEVNWAGTASPAFSYIPDHQVGYNFLFNQSSENSRASARMIRPRPYILDMQNRLECIERNLTTHQFRGDHLSPSWGPEI